MASNDYVYDMENLTALMSSLPLDEERLEQGARPKRKATKRTATNKSSKSSQPQNQPSSPPEHQSSLELERLKHENLKLQLEITQAQLELAKLQHSPSPASPQAAQSINAPSALHEALAASTPRQLHDLAAANFPTLEQLRDKKKPGASLPHNYVFSTQGTLSYDSLELPNFVYGYLEYVKEQPNLSHPALISHLQLLMQRAATYTWASVRSFHLAIATAVEQGRLTWNGFDTIRERSQTFFSHNDLRPSRPSAQRSSTQSSARPNKPPRDNFCRDWNYTSQCSCQPTSASYTTSHRCRVCDSHDHPMLHCPKRKYPIPNVSPPTANTIPTQA